jgi:hypothetical protein
VEEVEIEEERETQGICTSIFTKMKRRRTEFGVNVSVGASQYLPAIL